MNVANMVNVFTCDLHQYRIAAFALCERLGVSPTEVDASFKVVDATPALNWMRVAHDMRILQMTIETMLEYGIDFNGDGS